MDLDCASWGCGVAAAMLVGFSKTGVPGLGILIVPLMVSVFPGKTSAGALLPLLIFGDFFAVGRYHRHAHWPYLVRLFPWVAVGMLGGWFMLRQLSDTGFGPFLGGLVLGLLVFQLVRKRWKDSDIPRAWWFAAVAGISAGFATTVGNAAGAIMCVYLLSMRLPKEEFIGTGAWYYLIVNALKIPIFASEGMISAETLAFDACMLPVIAAGAAVGIWVLPRIPQKPFEWSIALLAAAASLKLIFPSIRLLFP
ncbi:MAG: sulfite exporter TauE/SafE family protein [Kiritimatiellae bacterium]|nr:sulfite exporter TauE/SafE family protein [Kiritimatiellia bacterium]